MSNFTKQVTVEEFWKQKYIDLADKYEALQIKYNAAAKQANMHPLLQEPDWDDIDPNNPGGDIPGGDITPNTKWSELDKDLEFLDRCQHGDLSKVEF